MPELYRVWDKSQRKLTRVTTDTETGLPLIVCQHDPSVLIEVNKRQANAFDPHANGWKRHGYQHVARIPGAVMARLRRTGVANDPKAFDAWLNERDNRVFRVDDGRTL